ncbi:hypothetical protein SEA_YOSIF_2 [Streptomyces phage Yosif]|uniref:Uncharacterized protein n=1 Tax=Streptomyces phage Yosif TaxID=2201421 RepID=A0A2Z4QCD0_9CAUD|nr:hypothetical protein KGG71_gp02 [Streptomyces phage Yosif]AWY07566.1 hypothetical protein SEA_YOSIF_2 [Streptomyces phage Yosif]
MDPLERLVRDQLGVKVAWTEEPEELVLERRALLRRLDHREITQREHDELLAELLSRFGKASSTGGAFGPHSS